MVSHLHKCEIEQEECDMHLVVSVCRVLASRSRLRLLRVIHEQPGLTVEALASAAALSVPVASRHLSSLANYQLAQATPGGRYVRYAPARPRSTSHRFLLEMQAYLQDMLGAQQPAGVLANVCAEAVEPTWTAVHDALIKLFTAYTHLRRLFLLRYLARRGASTVEQLCAQLNMSAAAAHRHLHKLQRRGLLMSSADSNSWMMATHLKPSGQRRLLAIVMRAVQSHGEGK